MPRNNVVSPSRKLVPATDEQAPGDETCHGGKHDAVHRVQNRPVAPSHPVREEVNDDMSVSSVGVGEEGEDRDPAGEFGDLVVTGNRSIEQVSPQDANDRHSHDPDQKHATRDSDGLRQTLETVSGTDSCPIGGRGGKRRDCVLVCRPLVSPTHCRTWPPGARRLRAWLPRRNPWRLPF